MKKQVESEISDRDKVKKIIDDIEQDEGVVNNEILKIAAEDVEVSHADTTKLEAEKIKKQESFYSDLIYTLSHIRMNEKEARTTWEEIIAHKVEMGAAMRRNVGIRVAALDYFQNMRRLVDDVRIVDSTHYIETKRLVVTDGVTGLFNHRYFYEKSSILFRQLRNKQIKNIGLLVMDLDYFKLYNDANGHIAGDIVLVDVSNIFKKVIGERGSVFRYGGEEFTVFVVNTDPEELAGIAEDIRRSVEEKDFVNEAVLPGGEVTLSIGASIFPDICKDLNHFFQNTDEAMYLAKKLGRNRVQIAQS